MNRICRNFGYPSPDDRLRFYGEEECEKNLYGIWSPDNICKLNTGGSYSSECAFLNSTIPDSESYAMPMLICIVGLTVILYLSSSSQKVPIPTVQ